MQVAASRFWNKSTGLWYTLYFIKIPRYVSTLHTSIFRIQTIKKYLKLHIADHENVFPQIETLCLKVNLCRHVLDV
eukprot:SAG11_NODE_11861_length_734_cov_1.414173_1_plen_76_part_00